MDINIITIFMSMAVTVAFTKLIEATNVPWDTWLVFTYFVFRRISYYVADIKLSPLVDVVFKENIVAERFLALLVGVSVLFLFNVVGYFVNDTARFMLFNALSLLINICFLFLTFMMIDPAKDHNPKLKIRQMFKNFIWINVIEIIISLVAGIALCAKCGFGIAFNVEKPWTISIAMGLLGFIMVIDFLFHKDFIFDPKYSPHKS